MAKPGLHTSTSWMGIFLMLLLSACGTSSPSPVKNRPPGVSIAPLPQTKVKFETSHGDFTVELYPEHAPITVQNFVQYAEEGFFDGTVFHRVIPGFVIQGGGFTPDMKQKSTRAPIRNEAANGLSNEPYTLSMARTNEVDSATSQFFVNLAHNTPLDHEVNGYGYAVFGKVTEGTEVIDAIARVQTGNHGMHQDVPQDPVLVHKVTVD